MAVNLDTAEKTQVHASSVSPRSIYDASKKEVFFRSFLAGLALGLGQAVASFLFFAVILGILLSYLEPLLDDYFPQLNPLDLLIQQRNSEAEAENAASPSPTTNTSTRTTN
jgi:hypothetical protein